MFRCRAALYGALMILCLPAPTRADTSLAFVPEEAVVVVHAQGVERLKNKVLAIARETLAGPGGRMFLQPLEDGIEDLWDGFLTEGRRLRGIPEDGSISLFLLDFPGDFGNLPVALVTRVNDYTTFRNGLLSEDERRNLEERGGMDSAIVGGQRLFFAPLKGHALVTSDRRIAESVLKLDKGGAARASLDRTLRPAQLARFKGNDLALFVNMKVIAKKYGDKITEFEGLMEKFGEMYLQENLLNTEEGRAAMKILFKGLFQLARDSREILLAARFPADVIALELIVGVGPGTHTNKVYLSKLKPAPLEELEKLPASYSVLNAIGPGSKELADRVRQLMSGMLTGPEGKASLEAIKLEQEAEVGLTLGGWEGRFKQNGVEVSHCKAPEKFLASQLKMFETAKTGDPWEDFILDDKPRIERNAGNHRGVSFHRVDLPLDLDASAKISGVPVVALRRVLGGDTLTLWIGTKDKMFVEVAARDLPTARRRLDEFLDSKADPLASRPGFQKTRKALPKNLSFLYLEESTIMAQMGLEGGAAAIGRIPPRVPRPAPGKAEYVAMGLVLQSEEVGVHFLVPTRTLRDFMQGMNELLGPGF